MVGTGSRGQKRNEIKNTGKDLGLIGNENIVPTVR